MINNVFDNMWESSSNLWNTGDMWAHISPIKWDDHVVWDDSFMNDFNKSVKDLQKTINEVQNTISETQRKISKGISVYKNLVIKFSYIVDTNISFAKNWDLRTDILKEKFIGATISTDYAEFYRSQNKVTGKIVLSEYKSYEDDVVDEIRCIIRDINIRYNISVEEIHINCDKKYDKSKQVNYSTLINVEPKQNTIDTSVNETPKPEQIKKPTKVVDESKTKYNKVTFEIVKKLSSIDGIPVNCLIVKQIRGTKDRKKYTLNANDCALLGIPYRDGLEILPDDLNFEKVYKKIIK